VILRFTNRPAGRVGSCRVTLFPGRVVKLDPRTTLATHKVIRLVSTLNSMPSQTYAKTAVVKLCPRWGHKLASCTPAATEIYSSLIQTEVFRNSDPDPRNGSDGYPD